jgi:tetratricopeptide (TPR) repeat protein
MKRRAASRTKSSAPNSKKKRAVTTKAGTVKIKPAASPLKDDPRFTQTVQNYEAGLRALQDHKFERAKGLLQKVVEGPIRELADRAAMHINICNQHLARSTTSFKTPEEHYDYAVSLMNQGKYDDARLHLEKILKQEPKADYAMYGLSVLDCLTNRVEDALRHLDEAIRMNPGNRYQARNDSDFQNLADDPRFTELLYPETGVDFPSPPTNKGR